MEIKFSYYYNPLSSNVKACCVCFKTKSNYRCQEKEKKGWQDCCPFYEQLKTVQLCSLSGITIYYLAIDL
jgi:hypothetical protein